MLEFQPGSTTVGLSPEQLISVNTRLFGENDTTVELPQESVSSNRPFKESIWLKLGDKIAPYIWDNSPATVAATTVAGALSVAVASKYSVPVSGWMWWLGATVAVSEVVAIVAAGTYSIRRGLRSTI